MNIKLKVTLFLLLAFFVNAALVFSFYQFYTLEEIGERLTALSDRYHETGETIRTYLGENPDTSPDELITYLEGDAFTFYDIEIISDSDGTLYERRRDIPGDQRVMSQILWEDQSGDHYTISFGRDINFQRAYVKVAVSKLVIFEIFLMFITVVTAFFYINHVVSKPLNVLRHQFKTFHSKSNDERTDDRGDEIKLLNSAFGELTEELKHSKEAQNELIASISHDIKNPLTSIMGYTERLIETEHLTETRKDKYHRTILAKANDIKRMLDEFNMYIEGESGVLVREPIELKPFIENICEEYSEELSGINRQFFRNCTLAEDTVINMDSTKIRRVISNIIGNSVKYAGEGASVYFSCIQKKDVVEFSIEDTGEGVPDSDLERIFDLMFRCGTDRNQGEDQAGSGLGLTICKRIVEQHAGEIIAYKGLYGGLGIRFTLPIYMV